METEYSFSFSQESDLIPVLYFQSTFFQPVIKNEI